MSSQHDFEFTTHPRKLCPERKEWLMGVVMSGARLETRHKLHTSDDGSTQKPQLLVSEHSMDFKPMKYSWLFVSYFIQQQMHISSNNVL